MEFAAIIAIADGAMTILERAVPAIQKLLAKGEVPNEQQQVTLDRYEALKASGFAFTRPEGK